MKEKVIEYKDIKDEEILSKIDEAINKHKVLNYTDYDIKYIEVENEKRLLFLPKNNIPKEKVKTNKNKTKTNYRNELKKLKSLR